MAGTTEGGKKAAGTRGQESLKKAGQEGAQALSHEQRAEIGKKAAENRGNESLSEAGRKGGEHSRRDKE
jgi:general stress protein YciG